jgi:hypothetical protein
MELEDLQVAYDIVNNRTVFDNIENPLQYKIPNIDTIHYGEHHKTIKQVTPSVLNYILYNLHNLDYEFVIETLMALLYYWKFRKRKLSKMEEAYKEVIYHYTVKHTPYIKYKNHKQGNCIYLVKIYMGSRVLYKVGITKDIHKRMINLQSDITSKYPYISVGIDIQEVIYCSNSEDIEETILQVARSYKINKHKLFFNGHSECFESEALINIFKQHTAQ